MRLSEAIRKGCETTVPFHDNSGTLRPSLDDPRITFACALGAAAHALTGERNSWLFEVELTLSGPYPYLTTMLLSCPACEANDREAVLAANIIHLNDDHEWTREQIADWVQAIEAIEGIGQDECHGPTGPCVREMGHEGDHVRPEPVLA